MLFIKQFDFQPLPISVMGNGTLKKAMSTTKRVKSSKLAPIKDAEEGKKTPSSVLRRKPSRESQKEKEPSLSGTMTAGVPQLGVVSMRKSHIRTSYPKLFQTKKTIVGEEEPAKTMNPAQVAEREYLNHFNRVQEMDKAKDIKFACYPGDKPMTEA